MRKGNGWLEGRMEAEGMGERKIDSLVGFLSSTLAEMCNIGGDLSFFEKDTIVQNDSFDSKR